MAPASHLQTVVASITVTRQIQHQSSFGHRTSDQESGAGDLSSGENHVRTVRGLPKALSVVIVMLS